MSRHTGQTSSKLDSHSDQIQLAVPTQRKKTPIHEIASIKNEQYQHQIELNLLQNNAAFQSRKESAHNIARQK